MYVFYLLIFVVSPLTGFSVTRFTAIGKAAVVFWLAGVVVAVGEFVCAADTTLAPSIYVISCSPLLLHYLCLPCHFLTNLLLINGGNVVDGIRITKLLELSRNSLIRVLVYLIIENNVA